MRKRCYYHGVLQEFLKSFGRFAGSKSSPAELGNKAQQWVRWIMYSAAAPEVVKKKHFVLLSRWIDFVFLSTDQYQLPIASC